MQEACKGLAQSSRAGISHEHQGCCVALGNGRRSDRIDSVHNPDIAQNPLPIAIDAKDADVALHRTEGHNGIRILHPHSLSAPLVGFVRI
jgi:hypothetical protein